MAYASPFDTIVCELRFKLFVWTLDLCRAGYKLQFTLSEYKHVNEVDLEITLRDIQGNLLELLKIEDIQVDIGLIDHVTTYLNGHFIQYGLHLN